MPNDAPILSDRAAGGFAEGTCLATPAGPVPVETLRAGDSLLTRGGGQCRLAAVIHNDAPPDAGLVRIGVGALGPDLPARELTVTADQRVLMRSDDTLRLFGTAEALVLARDLAESPAAAWPQDRAGRWVALDLGRAEMVLADGAWAELGAEPDGAPGALRVLSLQEIRIAAL